MRHLPTMLLACLLLASSWAAADRPHPAEPRSVEPRLLVAQRGCTSLGEVVVVGYGTKKKINLTGAVSTASGEDLANRPVTNVQQALQGLVSNLVIQPNIAGGEPGADMAMSIRGLAAFEGNQRAYIDNEHPAAKEELL